MYFSKKRKYFLKKKKDLKKCFVALVSLSFGMRIKDVAQLVESYVQHNDHETGKSFKI